MTDEEIDVALTQLPEPLRAPMRDVLKGCQDYLQQHPEMSPEKMSAYVADRIKSAGIEGLADVEVIPLFNPSGDGETFKKRISEFMERLKKHRQDGLGVSMADFTLPKPERDLDDELKDLLKPGGANDGLKEYGSEDIDVPGEVVSLGDHHVEFIFNAQFQTAWGGEDAQYSMPVIIFQVATAERFRLNSMVQQHEDGEVTFEDGELENRFYVLGSKGAAKECWLAISEALFCDDLIVKLIDVINSHDCTDED